MTRNGVAFAAGTGVNFAYTPNQPGSYVAALTVTDNVGDSASATATTAVMVANPFVAIGGTPTNALANAAVALTSSVTDLGTGNASPMPGPRRSTVSPSPQPLHRTSPSLRPPMAFMW